MSIIYFYILNNITLIIYLFISIIIYLIFNKIYYSLFFFINISIIIYSFIFYLSNIY